MQAELELNPPEVWRPIPWAPMYDVSNYARVRSWFVRRGKKTTHDQRAEIPRPVEPLAFGQVCIYLAPGEYRRLTARQLMRETFEGDDNVE